MTNRATEVKSQPSSVFDFNKLPEFGLKAPLKPFQVQGMLFLDEVKKGILADATGLGKTITCIGLFQWLEHYRKVEDNRWILVVPPSTIYQWASEFEKFSTFPEPTLAIYGRKQRVAAYIHQYWQFLIVSYQILLRDHADLYDLGIKNWVFDDAHFIRHHSAQTSRAAKWLVQDADRIILPTATPMQKDPRNLHSLLEVLGLSHEFGSLIGFTNHFCVIKRTKALRRDGTSYPREEFLGIRNKDELKKKIRPYIIMRTFNEVGDELPALTVKPVILEMSSKQKDIYDNLRHKIIKAYDSGAMSNVEILNTGFHTMRKICAGTRSLDMVEDVSVKLDAIMHFIENKLGNEKMLVYSYYKATVKALILRLEKAKKRANDRGQDFPGFATYTGDDSSKRYREDIKEKFLDPNSDLRILVGTDAFRVGINLQSARYILMVDLIMNAQEMRQLVGRIRRIGGKPHVVVYPMITKGTIEESLYRSLKYESALFDVIFDDKSDLFPPLSAIELATLLRG